MAQESQPTQRIIDIETIRDGTVILKNGGLRAVVMVRGINVYLKTENEQNSIISAFQEFLNGLDFPIEIIIHSRRLNILGYLEKINARKEQETNDLLRTQIDEYLAYIRDLTSSSTIMSKRFYVVVSYDMIALPARKGGLFPRASQNTSALPTDFETQKYQLDQRTDVIIGGLQRTGVNAARLGTEELVELFYNLYNPQEIEKGGTDIAKRLSLI
ncbi:MAG: hypothetical protein KGI50_04210 [Patescibacteria group bacterium]|nr:hypothetical protein [Patescibacteria group bacterium]MDE2438510.1 hypothetical protein [Patescibacteria group bacterium]